MAGELVTLRTRVESRIAARLERVALRNERSVAAELRIAIDRHLTAEAPNVKDGRK